VAVLLTSTVRSNCFFTNRLQRQRRRGLWREINPDETKRPGTWKVVLYRTCISIPFTGEPGIVRSVSGRLISPSSFCAVAKALRPSLASMLSKPFLRMAIFYEHPNPRLVINYQHGLFIDGHLRILDIPSLIDDLN
jgi:hypothetical protein